MGPRGAATRALSLTPRCRSLWWPPAFHFSCCFSSVPVRSRAARGWPPSGNRHSWGERRFRRGEGRGVGARMLWQNVPRRPMQQTQNQAVCARSSGDNTRRQPFPTVVGGSASYACAAQGKSSLGRIGVGTWTEALSPCLLVRVARESTIHSRATRTCRDDHQRTRVGGLEPRLTKSRQERPAGTVPRGVRA